ncbi:MAG: hypothetical protein NTW21_35045 [Verrucomicrobia bacterium]|nr:hypothetical protein [Verrucomicrobiota bacterium]
MPHGNMRIHPKAAKGAKGRTSSIKSLFALIRGHSWFPGLLDRKLGFPVELTKLIILTAARLIFDFF